MSMFSQLRQGLSMVLEKDWNTFFTSIWLKQIQPDQVLMACSPPHQQAKIELKCRNDRLCDLVGWYNVTSIGVSRANSRPPENRAFQMEL